MRRRLLLLLAALALGPLLLLAAGALLASTDGGQRWLAARISEQVNARIAGRLELRRAAISLDGLALEGVAITAPGDAAPAVEVRRLQVAPAIAAGLLRGRVRIHHARVEGARVRLLSPAAGGSSNLARAFAPTSPPAEEKPAAAGEAPGWEVAIDRLAVADAAVLVASAGQAPQVDLHDLSLALRGRIDGLGAELEVEAGASLEAPVRGEAGLELHAALAGGYRELKLRSLQGTFGGSTFSLRGAAGLDPLEATLAELQLRLLPEDVPGLVAGWQPTVPLRLGGEAHLAEGTLTTTLQLLQEAQPAPASADDELLPVKAGGTPAPRLLRIEGEIQPLAATWRLGLEGTGLDPRGFDARAPAGSVGLSLALQGAGLDDVEGRVEIPALELGAGRAGPIALDGHLQGDRLDLRRLSVELIGGKLQLRGWAEEERGDLQVELQAASLQRLLREAQRLATVAGVTLPELPPIRGAATLQGAVRGTWGSPAVEATLTSGDLVVASNRFVGLQATVDASALATEPAGQVSLQVERLDAGATSIAGLRADLQLAPARLQGRIDGSTPAGKLSADLDVARGAGWEELTFRRLDLGWPGATWSLRRPATLALADGVRVQELALRGEGGATLEASLHLKPGGALALQATAAGIDLARLPPAIVPAELQLGGLASAEAALAGTLSRPTGSLRLQVRDAALAQVEGLGLEARVVLDGESAAATVQGRHREGTLLATGRSAWPPGRQAPLELDATLDRLDLAEVRRILGLEQELQGQLRAVLELRGSLAAPSGALEVEAAALALPGRLPLDEATALLQARLGEALTLHAMLNSGDSSLESDLSLAISPAALARQPASLLEAPLQGSVQAAGFQLAQLLGWGEEGVRGRIDLQAELSGSILHPRGTSRLQLADGWNGEVGPLDLELTLHAAAEETRIDLASRLLGRPFLGGSVAAFAPPEQLAQEEALHATRLQGSLEASDLELGALAWAVGHRGRAGGRVDGTFRLGGTTGAPVVEVAARSSGLSLGKVEWGRLELDATYAATRLDAALAFSGGAGAAGLRAGWEVDLGAPALAAGSLGALAAAPLDVTFTADQLDLAFLAGLSRDLRQVEGRLDGTVHASGSLPLPTFEGALTLRDGRLGYTGYGDLRDLALELELQPDAIHLRRLEAMAAGRLRATGSALRQGAGSPYEIEIDLESRRFALTSDDLVRGWLDADAKITGEAGSEGIEARLAVARAQVELADTPGKSVQSLEPHPDFVVLRGGAFGVLGSRRGKVVKEPKADALPMMFELFSERPIRVEGTDVELQASSDLKVVLLGGSPQLVGSVVVESGHVLVMSRRFELERGRVYYTGAEAPGDPRLDVQARYDSPHAQVTITVGGTVSRPTTNLRSSPPMSEAQIAELIATGRVQARAGAGGGMGSASGAASALGTVLTNQLKKGIASKLPLDVISFQAGEEENFAGSRLEAGTYVTDRIYLGYARRFEGSADEEEKENANEVRFEYMLAPRWTLEVTYGDAKVGGADLMWTRDF